MDAIVGLLAAMNQKLDVIYDKLEIIHKELIALPDKVEYKKSVNDLRKATFRLEFLYKYLQEEEKRDKINGKTNFRKRYEKELSEAISYNRLPKAILLNHYDPMTVAFMSVACHNDFRLCELAGLETYNMRLEQENFLQYFKNALWLVEKSLERDINEHENWLKALNTDQFLIDWEVFFFSSGRKEQYLERYTPVFKKNESDRERTAVIKQLMNLGYLNINNFDSTLVKYKGAEISTTSGLTFSFQKNGKKSAYLQKEDWKKLVKNKHLDIASIKRYFKRKRRKFVSDQNNLILLSSAHNLAIDTIKHINFRII